MKKTVSPAPTYCRYAAMANAAENVALSITFSVDDDVASYDGFVRAR
ncbi:MAG TPA: hypothetical protein VLU46_12920 [Thermoanaerobaculia bacterium]|nr:hypothetical protein [Thermoanaerobaculia bacterium]